MDESELERAGEVSAGIKLPRCHECDQELAEVIEVEEHAHRFYCWYAEENSYLPEADVEDINVLYKCPNCGAELSDENLKFFEDHMAE